MKSISLFLLALQVASINGLSLVSELTKFYQTIVEKGFHEKTINKNSLSKLMNLFDGNPKYNEAGVEHVMKKLGMDENATITFDAFHKLVDKIYGDNISDDPYQPQEIHLALTSKSSEMKVMWTTMSTLDQPFVQYQLNTPNMNWDDKNRLITKLSAANYTYSVPEKWWPVFNGMLYEVNMINLLPEKKYSYRVGGFDSANNTLRFSDVFTFSSAPDHNDPNRLTKVFALADHGTFELLGWETTYKMINVINSSTPLKNNRPDFVFVGGDLAYAGLSSEMPHLNISKEDEFELIWDLLGIQNQPVAAEIPWMVENGNHERFYDWQAYMNRYHMPDNNPSLPSNGGFWYTFSYGNIQWITVSSEHDLSPSSEQYNFMIKALDAAVANRDNVPWIIFTIHKPIYCSIDGSPSFANQLEDILLAYDVDLTLTGHMHAYERIHPVFKGEVSVLPSQDYQVYTGADGKPALRKVDKYLSTGKGPVHVMQGHAGAMQFERWVQPQPDWSALRMANGLIAPNVSREDSVRVTWETAHPGMKLDLLNDLNCVSAPENEDLCKLYADLPLLSQRERDLAWNGYNYSSTFGFGYIPAVNATHLLYEMIPNVEGLLNQDSFWIVKDHKSVKK